MVHTQDGESKNTTPKRVTPAKAAPSAENKQYHFEKLSFISDANIDVYEEAIDFAFQNRDIRNVAISGAYGSGKSSVLATYEKRHTDKKFIHISLAHFQAEKPLNMPPASEKGGKAGQKRQISEVTLEGKILNQLLHQINCKKIPQTNFLIKRRIKWGSLVGNTVLIMTLLLCLMHMVLSGTWITYVNTIPSGHIREILDLTTSPYAFLISGILVFLITARFAYLLIKAQRFHQLFKKLKVQNNEIELFENTGDSFFDKYLNEVLYLFENADADVFVFDDMDRYNLDGIYERLREVNILLNIRLNRNRQTRRKNTPDTGSSKKVKMKQPLWSRLPWVKKIVSRVCSNLGKPKRDAIRFFFLLRDDMFTAKDRLKFFDYIVPIVPVIDGSNAYDVLSARLKQNAPKGVFEDRFLQGVSLYIDEMRMLKNICNELLVYYNRLKGTDISYTKMLAMIIYKNLFPQDFSLLQRKQGYVHAVFARKADYISVLTDEITQNISSKKSRMTEIKKEYTQHRNDLIKKYMDRHWNRNSPPWDHTEENLFKILNAEQRKEYEQERQLLFSNESFEIFTLEQSVASLEKERASVPGWKLCKILSSLKSDAFGDISGKDKNLAQYYADVKKNEYFPLLKYLLLHGDIDETYADYMTYFYSINLSNADKNFLRSVKDHTGKEYTYQLTNPAQVLSNLESSSFDRAEVLNFSLLTYLLQSDPDSEYVRRMLDQIRDNHDFRFIEQYFTSTPVKPVFAQKLCGVWSSVFSSALQSNAVSEAFLKDFSVQILYSLPIERLRWVNIGDCLCKYISARADYLNIENPDKNALIAAFAAIGVRFQSINYAVSNADLFHLVCDNMMFELTFDNIRMILQQKYLITDDVEIEQRNFSLIRSHSDQSLYSYVGNHLNTYMDVILNACKNTIRDDEAAALELINHPDITDAHRLQYIRCLKTRISAIHSVKYKSFWGLLLDMDTVTYSAENMVQYFAYVKKMDDHLIRFINGGNGNWSGQDAVVPLDEKTRKRMYMAVLKCKELRNKPYIGLLLLLRNGDSGSFAVSDVPDDKMVELINNSLITMDPATLQHIRKNYPNVLYPFIFRNITQYADMMNGQLFVQEELLEILSASVADKLKLKLLGYATSPISIVSKAYSDAVGTAILKDHYSQGDMEKLFPKYSEATHAVRGCVMEYILDPHTYDASKESSKSKLIIGGIIRGQIPADYLLKKDLLKQNHGYLTSVNKAKLFCELLKDPILSADKSNKQAWSNVCKEASECFVNMGLPEYTRLFSTEKKPTVVAKNAENLLLARALKQKGWINDFVDDTDPDKMRLLKRPRKTKNAFISS